MKKECPVCRLEFQVKPSHMKKRKYCSMACMAKGYKKQMTGNSNPNWRGGASFDCKQCGKSVSCVPARIKTAKFCSLECTHEGMRGPRNSSWKGRSPKQIEENKKIRSHPLYQEWRRKVFERDNNTCQSCMGKSEILHAHHVVKFSESPKARLKVSNGMTLCPQCHRDFHRLVGFPRFDEKEAALTKKAKKFFKTESKVKMVKIAGMGLQEAGLPDFMGVVDGQAAMIELKVYPKFASLHQASMMRRFKKAGAATFMCRSIEEVKRAVKVVKEAHARGEIYARAQNNPLA